MQHFVLRFAAFYLAFCCILPCVLHELALRFVGDSTAFCMSLHRVLMQMARKFIKNTVYLYQISLYQDAPSYFFLYKNKSSREWIICERVGSW